MRKRIFVIGGLAAGPSAANKAVRTNPNCDVVMFEQGEDISYGICEIPYFIAGEVKPESLISYTPESLLEKIGVDARTLHRVEEIIPHRKIVNVRDLKNGRTVQERYDRLVIATGSRPRKLGITGEEARNVFTVKSLDDGLNIDHYVKSEKPSRAVIIGGGYIGIEMADSLRKLDINVTMIHRSSLPMNRLEREIREMIRKDLEDHQVQFVGQTQTEGFVVNNQQKVTHVVTDNGSYEADLVIIAIGVIPNSELATAAGVRTGSFGGILTDQRQQTNLDSVYAAGDCCEVKNLVSNRPMYAPLATLASKMGWTAGENAAGGKSIFRGGIRSIAVRLFDNEIVQIGLSTEEAEAARFDVVTDTISAWSKVAAMPGSKRLWIKTIADRKSGRLLGANLFGEEGAVLRGNTLAVAIQHKLTVDEIRQLDLAYSPPFTPLWDPVLVAANSLSKKL